jgi:hypothetical protein
VAQARVRLHPTRWQQGRSVQLSRPMRLHPRTPASPCARVMHSCMADP